MNKVLQITPRQETIFDFIDVSTVSCYKHIEDGNGLRGFHVPQSGVVGIKCCISSR